MTLRVADMPPVYRKWLDGVEPAWTVLEAERVDALLAEPPFEDGAIRLAIDLTDDEIACSPMLQNALVLTRAAKRRRTAWSSPPGATSPWRPWRPCGRRWSGRGCCSRTSGARESG